MKIRLAQNTEEIAMAQRLRHQVFQEEFGARLKGPPGIDADRFDPASEHLLLIEPGASTSRFPLADGNLVGTYRLLTQASAQKLGGFYSENEFDLRPILAHHSELSFLELGRSCILNESRGAAAVELLWQGIWNFVRQNKVDVMFGCASFDGTDISTHAAALSLLAHHKPTPTEWQAKALSERYRNLEQLPAGGYDAKRAMASLPPLIKGYMRLGCYFGDGAVIDHDFNTIDVLVILPVASINPRYFAKFGAPA